MTEVQQIIEALTELGEDSTVPKNVKCKIITTIASLQNCEEISLVINRAIYELGQIADDCNMQSHVRTQIFSIVSMLENSDL